MVILNRREFITLGLFSLSSLMNCSAESDRNKKYLRLLINSTKKIKIGFYGGPSAGVEHFITESISLGIEGQILYMNLPSLGEKYLALDYASTRGVLFLRWYYD
jgi:hypothetical protein